MENLTHSIPLSISTFFITYISLNGLTAKPIAFLRAPGYIIFTILTKLSGSPRVSHLQGVMARQRCH